MAGGVELRQSTQVTLKIGPFVSTDDGYTPVTGLTIAQSDVLLSKNGGTLAQKSNVTSCTHDANGIYDCVLASTDTDTLGVLSLFVTVVGALPLRHDYMVMPSGVWNTLFGTSNLITDLSATALGDINSNLLDSASGVESGISVRQAMRALLAVLSGNYDVVGSTIKFHDPSNTVDRVSATLTNTSRVITYDLD